MKSCAVLLFSWLSLVQGIGAIPALVPLPQMVQSNAGSFTLCPPQIVPGAPSPAPTAILVDPASRETGEYLAMQLYKSTGYRFVIGTNSGVAAVPQAILLTTNSALLSLGSEGYELTVATDSVLIRAPTQAGLFYGIQTLLQLLPPEIYSPRPVAGVAWVAPCVYIQDWPRFSWRGWMLDSVRHFFNKDEVKALLDTLAMHKLNTFHWHLDDDAGWRIEILKYPLLTQVSGWRTDTMFGLNPRSSTAWDDTGTNYGGYYTQNDIREIVAYAAQRHITVVPEIEMPGHSSSALYAYPQYACFCASCSNQYSLNVTSYIGGAFCIARPETTNFVQDILTEVMGLFPGQYIHIGGDEVRYTNWMNHTLDQQMTNTLGLSGSGLSPWQKYQAWFTQGIANWIKSKGRTMIGWSEIMTATTITNAALMDWLTPSVRAVQAATNGENVVMTATTNMYINKWETATDSSGGNVIWSNEPPGQSGLVLLTNVYNYEPIPAGLAAAYTNRILGAQGNSWSEWIPSLQNMQFRMYPRLCAIAEVDWTPPALKNWTDFTNRWASHKLRLAKMGVNFNPYATPATAGTWSIAPASYATYTWDITSSVTNAGEVDISFCWKTGSNGLDIAWAALSENGVELDRDTHAGFTGVTPTKPVYVLRLPALRPGATYTLSASVQGRGGTNSTGIVYKPNWD